MTATTMPTPRGSSHEGRASVLALYRSLREVRTAIDELEAHGVDGDDIALVGPAALAAERTHDRTRTDRRFLRTTTAAIAAGIVTGSLVGAVIGAVLLGLTFAIWEPAVDAGWVFALMTCWFAAGGAVFGAFTAVSRRVGFSESWPLTFEDEPDEPLWLAVYDDREDVRETVRATHPTEVRIGSTDTVHASPGT
jgi:hypothetical protein